MLFFIFWLDFGFLIIFRTEWTPSQSILLSAPPSHPPGPDLGFHLKERKKPETDRRVDILFSREARKKATGFRYRYPLLGHHLQPLPHKKGFALCHQHRRLTQRNRLQRREKVQSQAPELRSQALREIRERQNHKKRRQDREDAR